MSNILDKKQGKKKKATFSNEKSTSIVAQSVVVGLVAIWEVGLVGWPPLFLDASKMPSAQLDFGRDDSRFSLVQSHRLQSVIQWAYQQAAVR